MTGDGEAAALYVTLKRFAKRRISGLLVVVPNGLETPYFSVTGVAEKGVTA